MNGRDALQMVKEEPVPLVLLDLLLPGLNGIEILKQMLEIHPAMIVIMMSGHGNIEIAIEATKLGAYDWLQKPLEKDRLLLTLKNAWEKSALLHEKQILLSEMRSRYRMLGVSDAMRHIFQLIDKVAAQDVTVLITGESGTGKELVARAIHMNSKRAADPFVNINCAAVPETLIESELFGHTKGAFTGAVNEKKGKFHLADGGTLFLDEIGDLSLQAQAKVLRAIELGEVEKVGGEKTENVDVRLLSATNKNLSELMAKGAFREDLYHRIHVITLDIPPLRNRTDDILPLADFFLETFCAQDNIEKKKWSPQAETLLVAYPWPGNVRELKNFVKKMIVLSEENMISASMIAQLLELPETRERAYSAGTTFQAAKTDFERNYLLENLKINQWNISKTAQQLGLPRSVLYKKMNKYGIQKSSGKGDAKHS